jgi:hypothetical protein
MVGKKGGLRRHFEGWEAGVVAVAIAVTGVLLALPLAVAPRDLPAPTADEKALSVLFEREHGLATAIAAALREEIADPAKGTHLFDLRAFGEAFRAYGRSESADETYDVLRARQKLLEALARARSLGDDKLLALRAYQKELFGAELTRWEDTGQSSDELTGLGGKFLTTAERDGWLEGGTVAMGRVLRGIFFKRRWNEITGLTDPPFALSLDEHRAFYAFLLEHPFVDNKKNLQPADACRVADQWRLRKIEELGRIDPAYPYALARGVLFYRLGRYPAAAQSLRDYLATADGRYALRARNYLAAAVSKAQEEP